MTIRSDRNQYLGVNAHLHSHFQSKGGWSSFHANYIGELARTINDDLPPGYVVDMEQSLQIREIHPDTGERIRRPKPDLTIYDVAPNAPRPAMPPFGETAATLTQPVAETLTLTEDLFFTALVIYQSVDDEALGRPVTRIELLSPANKQAGDGYLQYIEKRDATLRSGLRLVEIDYLHETRSPIKGLPGYPEQPGSYPYHITVSDPQPSLDTGLAKTYAFNVDSPIPVVDIPLVGDDSITVDFGAAYDKTYSSLAAYSLRVDYGQLPERFDRYSAADQQRIWRRMQVVQDMERRGVDLEEGPFSS